MTGITGVPDRWSRLGQNLDMKWRNWAGNQKVRPAQFLCPGSEEELSRIIAAATSEGRKVRVAASGHSFTAAAVCDDVMLSVGALSGLRSVDRSSMTVTVGAGTPLWQLNELLHAEGLAMPNLGDIAYQTVAGAVSTSTHGTGVMLPGLSAQVRGFRMVDGTGHVRVAGTGGDTRLADVGRVSLGALGVMTEYTLAVVPSFVLEAVETPMRVDRVLDGLDELVHTNDHFEFFWVPHTGWALTKRNNRVDGPPRPLPRFRGWYEKTFMENYAFGAVCRAGRAFPAAIPRLAKALPASGERTYSDVSHRIFASPRLVRFYEMEQSLPYESLAPALRDVMSMVERRGHRLNFPVEVRFTAPDDVPLSTGYGRVSAYIAVHVYKGMDHVPYFGDVEEIMRSYGARPHWGKLHDRGAAELRDLYPRWDEFQSVRNETDPQRVFTNGYVRRVLGD